MNSFAYCFTDSKPVLWVSLLRTFTARDNSNHWWWVLNHVQNKQTITIFFEWNIRKNLPSCLPQVFFTQETLSIKCWQPLSTLLHLWLILTQVFPQILQSFTLIMVQWMSAHILHAHTPQPLPPHHISPGFIIFSIRISLEWKRLCDLALSGSQAQLLLCSGTMFTSRMTQI